MQTNSAMSHHRVNLVEVLTTLVNFLNTDAEVLCKLCPLVLALRNELVERRVKQTEHNRLAVHNLEGSLD